LCAARTACLYGLYYFGFLASLAIVGGGIAGGGIFNLFAVIVFFDILFVGCGSRCGQGCPHDSRQGCRRYVAVIVAVISFTVVGIVVIVILADRFVVFIAGGVLGAPGYGSLDVANFDVGAGVAVVVRGANDHLGGKLVAGVCEVDGFDGVVGGRL
jgi:hypothetical protein